MRVFAVSIAEKKRIIKRWILIFFAGIILNLIWLIFAPYGFVRIYLISKENEKLNELKIKKEEELASIEATLKRIENMENLDEFVREELRLFKKNEIIFIFDEKKAN